MPTIGVKEKETAISLPECANHANQPVFSRAWLAQTPENWGYSRANCRVYRAIYAENGKLPASAQCADILVYVFALSRDHEHGSAMSRQTATWRCRVRDTPRLRRRRVHATANPAGFIASPITNAAFAAHECPRIVSQNPLLYCRFGIRGKVHGQAHFHVRQPEIVHQLGTMLGRQFGNCLDLN